MAHLPVEMVRKDKKADQQISWLPNLIHQKGISSGSTRSFLISVFAVRAAILPVLILG